MLISMERVLVATDPRFSINSNGERTWYLTISPVQDADKGEYMCQVNTNPMKKIFGYLHVVGKCGNFQNMGQSENLIVIIQLLNVLSQ